MTVQALQAWWSHRCQFRIRHGKLFLILPQHPQVILKLDRVIYSQSTSSSKARTEQPNYNLFLLLTSVSQNLKILGLSSSAGWLLCAWKVKQLLNPSAFSQVKNKTKKNWKIQDSTKNTQKSTHNILSKWKHFKYTVITLISLLTSHLDQVTMCARWVKKKNADFIDFFHLILFLGLWKMFNGWVIFFTILYKSAVHQRLFFGRVLPRYRTEYLSWDSLIFIIPGIIKYWGV